MATVTTTNRLIELNREIVSLDYKSANDKNQEMFLKGNVKATSMYIYPNQAEDSAKIIDIFYNSENIRVLSIFKKTKVGMDGLMIEVAKNFATHPDDNFMVHRENVLFVTGMSNVMWENDMKNKMPACFKENIFHHGKLQNLKDKLKTLNNGVIILDEIDAGDKIDQKLERLLKESGLLDINTMIERNIRFIFGSATPLIELKKLFEWGDKYTSFILSVPDNYIGHKGFLDMNVLKDSYLITANTAEKWVKEDIIDTYKGDYRVHLIRTDNKKVDLIQNACIKYRVHFKNHTSEDRINDDELSEIFNNINNHTVIAVKGLLRRANFIPNQWKLKIGAVHEYYAKKPDISVQIQGLIGRMTGYWKDVVISGHRIGPYRCHTQAVCDYEAFYNDPTYNLKISKSNVFMDYKNIKNLVPVIRKPKNKRVPIVVENIDKHHIIFTDSKLSVNVKVKEIVEILNKQGLNKLIEFIQHPNVVRSQITAPSTDTSYKKHIVDVVKSYNNNSPFSIDNIHKDKNNWQCFIDTREHRLCFVIWVVDEEMY
jgi:hypothetical protein